jgi:hypothetical protein
MGIDLIAWPFFWNFSHTLTVMNMETATDNWLIFTINMEWVLVVGVVD